eukprot:TRINITY_DN515_c0_g1_i2.p1 TRINITY_DN515_c0_g1~~TRINITY_DN515_c0_g1_i2.p1  ORF type:complete len:890 (-),score=246.34 TRINITY_DN515_c0_g1_i2:103-2772(-)
MEGDCNKRHKHRRTRFIIRAKEKRDLHTAILCVKGMEEGFFQSDGYKEWEKSLGPIPPDEEDRLEALRALQILYSESEEEFDRVTTLCQRMFDSIDAACINFIDNEKSFNKSLTGPMSESTTNRIWPRSTYCSNAVYHKETLIVPDTTQGEFKDHPLTTLCGWRFYAGVPLMTKEGHAVGTLCLNSQKPREFSETDKKNLEDLAKMTMQIIELRLSNLKEKQKVEKQKIFVEELKDDRDMLFTGLNNFPEGLFLWDIQSKRVSFVNDAFVDLVGYSRREISEKEGYPIDFWVEKGCDPQLRITFQEIFDKPRDFSIDFEGASRGGEKRYYSLHLAPASAKITHCFGILADISFRKRNEMELKQSQKEALQAAEAKTTFLANVSHEIRTPLNAIFASTELILETPQNGEQKELSHMIHSSAHTLLSVVNDILDFNQIESNEISLQPSRFDLRNCIESCIDSLYRRATQNGLMLCYSIQPDVPSEIGHDESRLRQILTNLLNNGVNFTSEGEVELLVSVVKSSVSKDEKEEETLTLEFVVRDTGIGIEQESLDKLFRSFSQLDDSRTRKYGGMGIGLAISSKLASVMGGKMWVTSSVGKGSSFHFTLPTPNLGKGKRHLSTTNVESKRIALVAKGSEERMLRSLLLSLRTQVKSFLNWEEVEASLQKESFDAIMFGQNHPQNVQTIDIPVIYLIKPLEDGSNSSLNGSYYLKYPIHYQSLRYRLENIFLRIERREKRAKNSPSLNNSQEGIISSLHKASLSCILMVEDNKFNQRILMKLLESLGYKADVAENGLEAVEATKKKEYDIIFMDLQMPIMDGLEASKIIRAGKGIFQKPFILAVTADVLHGIEDKCRETGMRGYIAKPVKKQQIIESMLRLANEEPEDWIVIRN